MTQRRLRSRTQLRLPISLGGKLPALTADVSEEGFKAEMMMHVFLPGSKIHGFVLHGDAELPFKGEVQWAQAGNPQASLHSEVGVRFTELSPELAGLLAGRKPKAGKKRKRP